MKMGQLLAAGIALSAASLAYASGGILLAEFALHDHPDGNAAPPFYGLRLDNMFGSGIGSLSMDHYDNTRLFVYEDNGSYSMNITGMLYGGLVVNNAYVDPHDFQIDFWYHLNVSDTGNGWVVDGFTTGNTGTMTDLDNNSVYTLFGKANDQDRVFEFLADGFRLDNDTTSWVGRGWLTPNSDGSNHLGGSQDWLFTATAVPAPTSAALLGLAGICATRRRR
ncbi:MAG: PEP-CTERM sorting domain-containing protein [Phycisphaerales bacterium]|nr:PEP-CTERM sorting domain-containing protein [Phycisphaerales bacterium]